MMDVSHFAVLESVKAEGSISVVVHNGDPQSNTSYSIPTDEYDRFLEFFSALSSSLCGFREFSVFFHALFEVCWKNTESFVDWAMISEALICATDDAFANRLAFGAEGVQEFRARDAAFHIGDFPREVVGVLDACIAS